MNPLWSIFKKLACIVCLQKKNCLDVYLLSPIKVLVKCLILSRYCYTLWCLIFQFNSKQVYSCTCITIVSSLHTHNDKWTGLKSLLLTWDIIFYELFKFYFWLLKTPFTRNQSLLVWKMLIFDNINLNLLLDFNLLLSFSLILDWNIVTCQFN